MLKLETFSKENYQYFAAGRFWVVRQIRFTRLPDGSVGLDQEESHRIHKAIANCICGSSSPLSFLEFEFLSDVTSTTFTEIANHLDIHKSTISRWRRSAEPLSRLYSFALKRYFWFQLFSDKLNNEKVSFEQIRDEGQLLHIASQKAIDHGLADSISALEAA